MKTKMCALALGSYLTEKMNACWQTTVTSFSNNNGELTDYLTQKDEITMQFGVGKMNDDDVMETLVAYQYSNYFT